MDKKFPKGSPQFINRLNKIRILNIIRENKYISRADIAKVSKISAPTVTRIVESLISDEALVRQVGIGESSGGRKPTLIEFSGLDNFVIGIDLGTTHIDGVLANLNAKTIIAVRQETKLHEGFESIMSQTAEIICELQNHPKAKNKKIHGVGLAVPGLVNRRDNIIETSPDLNWEYVDLKKTLSDRCDLPIKLDNVNRVMALGELWYGVGKTAKNFIVINVGYGIGAGIIIEGIPLYGSFGMAGEFGHMTMEKHSKIKCSCGNYDCLEALASGHSIAQRAQESISSGEKSLLTDIAKKGTDFIDAKLVAQAARKGDLVSSRIFNQAIEYLGIAISGIINLLSPEVVLIGGGVSQAEDLIFDKIREIASQRTIKTKSRNVIIKPVTFGLNAATKGAVALILNEVLNLNHLEQ
jgi:glucokinase-like ROK family protein